jgi:uncharacterized membrane protein
VTIDALGWRIGYVLRIGNALSTALLALGVLVALAAPAAAAGPLLVDTGLMIVIATPIVRVVVAMIGFAQARDWKFLGMTAAVLAVLAASAVAAFE